MLISSFKDTNISFKERLFRNATVEGVDYTEAKYTLGDTINNWCKGVGAMELRVVASQCCTNEIVREDCKAKALATTEDTSFVRQEIAFSRLGRPGLFVHQQFAPVL